MKLLKWVGSKEAVASQLIECVPEDTQLYVEPFVGGGSLFFALKKHRRVDRVVLGDINYALILTYKVVQHYPSDLLEVLTEVERDYLRATLEDQEAMYYQIRDSYNALLADVIKGRVEEAKFTVSGSIINLAALFITLNKTGYRGLYRVNKKGKYNTPWGKYIKPNIVNEDGVMSTHRSLQNTELYCGDYRQAGIKAKDSNKAFIYLDPPYVPLSGTSKFTEYGEKWDQKEHQELAEWFGQLGCKAMMTNSVAAESLYAGYNVSKWKVARRIKGPETVTEIIVKNYDEHTHN